MFICDKFIDKVCSTCLNNNYENNTVDDIIINDELKSSLNLKT